MPSTALTLRLSFAALPALLWWGCAAPSLPAGEPVSVAPIPASAAPVAFEIAGRATPGGLDMPPLPEAAPLVADRCAALAGWPHLRPRAPAAGASGAAAGASGAAAGASAPDRCSVERLAVLDRPDLPPRYALRLGEAMIFADGLSLDAGITRARARWSAVDPILSICLGDPFDLPPARDPGARRVFRPARLTGASPEDVWEYRFTGGGPCRLDGVLEIHARADRADAARLHVGGAGWSEGGRAAVRGWMRDQLVRDAADPSSLLTTEQRAQIRALDAAP